MLAIWAAEALLMALVLKLKVSSALADSDAAPAPGTSKVPSRTFLAASEKC